MWLLIFIVWVLFLAGGSYWYLFGKRSPFSLESLRPPAPREFDQKKRDKVLKQGMVTLTEIDLPWASPMSTTPRPPPCPPQHEGHTCLPPHPFHQLIRTIIDIARPRRPQYTKHPTATALLLGVWTKAHHRLLCVGPLSTGLVHLWRVSVCTGPNLAPLCGSRQNSSQAVPSHPWPK